MTRLQKGLLIAAAAAVLLLAGAVTVFYVTVYRPIGSPLLAMSTGRILEGRLQNQATFTASPSGALTAEQVARFVGVEQAVQSRVLSSLDLLGQTRIELEQASQGNTVPLKAALAAYSAIKQTLIDAKVAQVEAMNRANLSKSELEWVRRELYRAAGVPLAQLDVSAVLEGQPDGGAFIRRFDSGSTGSAENQQLARPLAAQLETWGALAFFGL